MKVIVDTSVWSLALRKSEYHKDNPFVKELSDLIREGRVQMIGPIRQELLSGIKFAEQFKKLKKTLTYFIDLQIKSADYEKAAELFNLCRKSGIQGSNTDFLICAIAVNQNMAILAVDEDFIHFNKYISDLKLIKPRILS